MATGPSNSPLERGTGQRAGLRPAPERRGADDILIVERWPLLPDGEYDATGGKATIARHRLFGSDVYKLVVPWTIVLPNDEAELGVRHVTVARFYNVAIGPQGRFRTSKGGDFFREAVIALGRRLPARLDRISRDTFTGVMCSVRVEAVVKDFRQRPLQEHARYSRVVRVIEHKAGGSSL